jgi:hypothetical protein
MSNLCNLCNDEIGMKVCVSCVFHICNECCDNLTNLSCPTCRKSLKKKIYFAGKIGIESIEKYDSGNRILVTNKNKNYFNDKTLRIKLDQEDKIIKLSEFLNLTYKIPIIEKKKHLLTGPCVVLTENFEAQHGQFGSEIFQNMIPYTDILNKRNEEMIKNCEIFILTINNEMDCFCSIKEWGIALAYGKIMILDFLEIDNIGEFYTFAQDSLQCFEKINPFDRDVIINFIPNFKFKNWVLYKQYLKEVVNKKNINKKNIIKKQEKSSEEYDENNFADDEYMYMSH